MQINLSEESVNIIVNSLNSSKISLKNQINKLNTTTKNENKLNILKNQLKDCEYVLKIFEELI